MRTYHQTCNSISDGSDGYHHHKRHHLRQRRGGGNSEWSPSEAIYEKSQKAAVQSQITFGQGVDIDVTLAKNWVFFTANGSTVKAHIGSTAVLPCEVKKDSQFGVVRFSSSLTTLLSVCGSYWILLFLSSSSSFAALFTYINCTGMMLSRCLPILLSDRSQ